MESFETAIMIDTWGSADRYGWEDAADLEVFVRKCAAHGITRLFWRLSEIGGFSYPTGLDRLQKSPGNSSCFRLIRKINILEYLPRFGRKYGLKMYGWFTMYDEGWFPRYASLIPNIRRYYSSFPLDSRLYRNVNNLEYQGFFRIEPEFAKYFPGSPGPEYKHVLPAVEMGKNIRPEDPWGYYTDFGRQHPEFLVEDREGLKLGRCLSYAYPEVRNYRRGMIEEMLSFGLDGVLTDFTRWPIDGDVMTLDEDGTARFGYEKPLSDGFLRTTGRDPRRISNNDPDWVRYRAEHGPTKFLQELRTTLKQQFPGREICAMAPPDNYLAESFLDVEKWLDHRLVDTLLPYQYPDRWRAINEPNVREHRLSDYLSIGYHWANLGRNKVRIINCIKPCFYNEQAVFWQQEALSPRELYLGLTDLKKAGSQGIAFYEEVTLTDLHWQTVKMFREGKTLTDVCAFQKKMQQQYHDSVNVALKPQKSGGRLAVLIDIDKSSGFQPDIIRCFLYSASRKTADIPLAVLLVRQKQRLSGSANLKVDRLQPGRYRLEIVCWQSEIGVKKTASFTLTNRRIFRVASKKTRRPEETG